MKRVLITGAHSYIGTRVAEWLKRYPDKYHVDVISVRGTEWKEFDFSKYDSILHVAGIAHRKDASDELYEQVNHLLAVDVAKKALESRVKQFIFMSTGAVYSQSDRKHKVIVVDENSPLDPQTAYGISKMKAEIDISRIKGIMKVALIRSPMVYGENAKGNYKLLSKIARKSSVFPKTYNQRSMIYIENLCEFLKLVIDFEGEGVYLPQNAEYVNTSEMVKTIAGVWDHKIWITPIFNWLVIVFGLLNDAVNKVVGSYCYDDNVYFDNKYRIVSFRNSIIATEKGKVQVD